MAVRQSGINLEAETFVISSYDSFRPWQLQLILYLQKLNTICHRKIDNNRTLFLLRL